MGKPHPYPPPPPLPPPPPDYPQPGYRQPIEDTSASRKPYQPMGLLTIPPDALVYLFPEFFAKRVHIGGFKAPYANVKVSHKSLYKALITAPLAYMEYMRVADLRLGKRGKVFKRDKVVVVKIADFRGFDYGLISAPLKGATVGYFKDLFDCIYGLFVTDVSEPVKYYIDMVYRYKVKGKIRIDGQWDVARYRREAETLYGIWIRQRGMKPRIYSVAEKDAERAANARHEPVYG